jgi:hypothetical protein
MLSQRAKGAYETNLESQVSGQAITSDQMRVRELPVYGGVERRRAPGQSGVLQRDLRFAGLHGRIVRLRARPLRRVTQVDHQDFSCRTGENQ